MERVAKLPSPLSLKADVNNLAINNMFDIKKYKHDFYLADREKNISDSKKRYIENRERILERRKELAKLETPEKREKRLSFHKMYNKEHCEINHSRGQSDEYKYKMYSFAASRREYGFSLSFEDFKSLFHSSCTYCGKVDARGIDRVDNSLGYSIGNSVACCEMCNKMKWKWNKDRFLTHVIQIANFNKKL